MTRVLPVGVRGAVGCAGRLLAHLRCRRAGEPVPFHELVLGERVAGPQGQQLRVPVGPARGRLLTRGTLPGLGRNHEQGNALPRHMTAAASPRPSRSATDTGPVQVTLQEVRSELANVETRTVGQCGRQ
jgi:hypothetical protein